MSIAGIGGTGDWGNPEDQLLFVSDKTRWSEKSTKRLRAKKKWNNGGCGETHTTGNE